MYFIGGLSEFSQTVGSLLATPGHAKLAEKNDLTLATITNFCILENTFFRGGVSSDPDNGKLTFKLKCVEHILRRQKSLKSV
jgi:hypothetical protein